MSDRDEPRLSIKRRGKLHCIIGAKCMRQQQILGMVSNLLSQGDNGVFTTHVPIKKVAFNQGAAIKKIVGHGPSRRSWIMTSDTGGTPWQAASTSC